MPLAAGTKAPDFCLRTKTAEGLKDVRLSEHLGRRQVVLLFFPAAFTSICTQEMCDTSSGLSVYSNLNAEVYGISVDSPHALEAWARLNRIGVTLLSDYNKQVIRDYDVVFSNFAGAGDAAARAAFVIGTDGVIKYSERTPSPKDLPNFEAIRQALAG